MKLPVKPDLESIRIRYDLKRIYFTLLVPVIIGILIVAIPFALGMTQTLAKAPAVQDDKLKAYEQFVAASGEGEGAPVNQTPAAEAPEANPLPLDVLVIFGVLVAVTPFAIDMTVFKRRLRQKEELFAEFLFKLSELMRGGLDPVKAVTELARTDLGPLTSHVQIAATSMVYGKTFDEAMRGMARSMGSMLIGRYIDLVIQASTSGGSTADLILRASEDMRSIIAIEREKEGSLAQYTFIFYFAQAILVFIAYILSTNLLTFVQQLGAQTFFGKNQIADLNFRQGFFHLLMINSFFGGLIIGKITEGEARYGLKHAVVLMVTCLIACGIFILPVEKPVPSENLTISVVSGDGQEGLPNVPVAQPIVFQAKDKNGNPVSKLGVSFSIQPGGMVTPSSDTTDQDGFVKVKVRLGTETGSYFVLAQAEGVISRATVTTSKESGGGG
ncbi:MAG TPA: type II secretion system F family protein [Methanomicrobiales archaeon]|nr:type II secretion system F family protein [Methanomicrobiales archaeon]